MRASAPSVPIPTSAPDGSAALMMRLIAVSSQRSLNCMKMPDDDGHAAEYRIALQYGSKGV